MSARLRLAAFAAILAASLAAGFGVGRALDSGRDEPVPSPTHSLHGGQPR